MGTVRWSGRFRDEGAATAVEYAILASLIAAVIVMAVFAVGRATQGNFDCTGESIETQTSAC
jgi:Flp pilus assembly pilin Flp